MCAWQGAQCSWRRGAAGEVQLSHARHGCWLRCFCPPSASLAGPSLQAVILIAIGAFLVAFFADPVVESITAFSV